MSEENPEPAGSNMPLWRNVRWFQLAFGVIVGVVGLQLAQHFRGEAPLSQGGLVLRIFGLALLTLVFVVYLQNVYRFGLVPDYSLKCRFCNGPVNRYSEFCEHCGADLIADEKLKPCPKCGVELYEGTAFCPECGAGIAAKKGKGKKSQKRDEPPPPPPPEAGWSRPLDAASPPPWEDQR